MMLANPWGLLALLGIPLVFFFHRRAATEQRVVSLVSLWRPAAAAGVRRADRRRLDLLLLLRLLFVAALVLALARPSWPVPSAGRHIFLLDASASMGAREAGGVRLRSAIEAAEGLLQRLPSGDAVMILRAGTPPNVVHEPSRDRGSLRAAMAAIRPGEAPKDLTAGLALARRGLGDGRALIHVFSDLRAAGDLARMGRPLGFDAADLRLHPVGGPADNLAIVALEAAPLALSPLDLEVFAQVANFSGRPRAVMVRLSLPDGRGEARRVSLAPGERGPIVFVAPAVPWVEVRLEGNDDALPIDDRATLALPAAALRVLYVSRGDRFLGAALRAHPRLQVQEIPAARLRGGQWSPATADVAVVDGEDLPPDFPLPALVFAAPALPAPRGSRAVAVQEWRREHPLVRELDLGEVVVPAGAVLAGEGAGVFIRSADGPIARAATVRGIRRVEFAFPIGGSNLGRLPAFPVLMARALEWLADRGETSPRNLHAGQPLRTAVPEGVPAALMTMRRPDGSAQTAVPEGGQVLFAGTDATGRYEVEGPGVRWHFAVNLLDPEESNVSRTAVAGEERPGPAVADGPARRDLAGPLLALALPLLSLEIWLLRRTARRRTA